LLFTEGATLVVANIKLFFALVALDSTETYPIRFGVAVSSKKFKRAHERNYIKRVFRELFRIHQHKIIVPKDKQLLLCGMYIGGIKPKYHVLQEKWLLALQQLNKQIENS
jgi:ribonuclease P protein component